MAELASTKLPACIHIADHYTSEPHRHSIIGNALVWVSAVVAGLSIQARPGRDLPFLDLNKYRV